MVRTVYVVNEKRPQTQISYTFGYGAHSLILSQVGATVSKRSGELMEIARTGAEDTISIGELVDTSSEVSTIVVFLTILGAAIRPSRVCIAAFCTARRE